MHGIFNGRRKIMTDSPDLKQTIFASINYAAVMLGMLMLSISTGMAAPTGTTLYIFSTPMQQVSGSIPFSAHNQSLRGAGAGATTIRIPILNQSWSATGSTGSFVTLRSIVNGVVNNNDVSNWIDKDVLELDTNKFGGKAGGDTSGNVAFTTGIERMTNGQVNVDLPVNVELEFPQANTFRGGDTIVIRSRYTVDTANSRMSTTPLGGALTLDGAFVINTGVTAEVCIKDCASLPGNTRVKINSLSRILPMEDPNNPGSYIIPPIEANNLEYIIDPLTTFVTGLSGTVSFPTVRTNNPIISPDGSMEDSGSHQFTKKLNIDIDSYLKYIGGPPLGFQSPQIASLPPVQVGYDLIDYSFDVDMTQHRSVKFTPGTVQANLNLGASMAWAVLDGADETHVLASGNSSVVPFKAGNAIALTLPADQTTETAANSDYSLPNTFTHSGDMIYEGAYKNQALAINFTVPEFEIYGGSSTCLAYGWKPLFPESHCHGWDRNVCIGVVIAGECIGYRTDVCNNNHTHWPEWVCIWKPTIPKVVAGPWDVSLGHLATASIPLPSTTDHFLPKTSHELTFAKQSGPTFSIDPENPVIVINKEVSKVVNNGGGSRTVTYTMLVRNDGDVPLDAVQVKDLLTDTFSGATGFSVDRVHSCKLTTNLVYDGGNPVSGNPDAHLVMPVYKLDPAEEAVVELQVTVHPQAFPPLYANTGEASGTSVPRGTDVTAVSDGALATVDMGPAKVEALGDFVLFADEKVELDGMANSSGHIGSNEEIEIGEHNHSVLAGDLRARKEIKAEGLLTADYAISGDAVELDDDGVLTLTGGEVRDEAMAIYPLPQAVFTSGGANVKVKAEGGPLTLLPGSYGKVRVKVGGVLLLTAGEYSFDALRLDADSDKHDAGKEDGKKHKGGKDEKKHDGDEQEAVEIVLPPAKIGFDTSSGPIALNIAGKVRLGAGVQMRIVSAGGSTRDVAINIRQDDELRIPQGVSVQGVLTAPNAELEFGPLSSIEGAAYAKSITMRQGSVARYHAAQWQGSLYQRIDANCDGIPDHP